MITHVWSVLCSRSVIDTESNNITLVEILEQITLQGLPPTQGDREGVVPIHVELVTLWSRTRIDQPGQSRARTTFIRPSGPLTESVQEYPIDLREHRRLRQRTRLAGLTIREPGFHAFRVEYLDLARNEWSTVAEIPLEVAIHRT